MRYEVTLLRCLCWINYVLCWCKSTRHSFSPGYLKWRYKGLGECLKFYLPLQYCIFFPRVCPPKYFPAWFYPHKKNTGNYTHRLLFVSLRDNLKKQKKKEPYSISAGRAIRINSNKPIRKRTLPSYVMSVFAQKFKLIWEQNNLFRLCTFNRVLQSSPTPHDQFSLTGHTRI